MLRAAQPLLRVEGSESVIARAAQIFHELDALVIRLKRNRDSVDTISRLKWVKEKHNAVLLQNKLREIRLEIAGFVGVENLWVKYVVLDAS